MEGEECVEDVQKGAKLGGTGRRLKEKEQARESRPNIYEPKKIKENSEARTEIRKIFLGEVWRKKASVCSRQKDNVGTKGEREGGHLARGFQVPPEAHVLHQWRRIPLPCPKPVGHPQP